MTLLYEDSVDKNEGERDDEEDVGKVEDELGHVVLRAVSLHIPVSDTDLKTLSFGYLKRRANQQNILLKLLNVTCSKLNIR